MNILYIGGESSNFVLNLCNEIGRKGHNVTCIIQTADRYGAVIPHKNVEIIEVPINMIYSPKLYELDNIKNIVVDKKIDVIFGSHVTTCVPVVILGRKYKIPTGLLILDIPTDLLYGRRDKIKQWIYWFDVMDFINEIVFINKIHVGEYLKFSNRSFPDENIVTYAINQIPEYYRAGIDKKGDNIITMCRLHEFKNCIFVPKALSYLDSIQKYVAIGRDYGELQNITEECIKNNISFEHLFNISDKEKYEKLKDALALVYPENSEFYGSGLTPWEAMYVGIPALVPERDSKRFDYGEHAFYYDGDNPESLARQISYIYSLRKYKIIDKLNKAAEYAKEKASFDAMSNGIIKILEKMVK